MVICINCILISAAWVFPLLLSLHEAQHRLGLAGGLGEACVLLESPGSRGPANLTGRGPFADRHSAARVRLLSAALLIFPSFYFCPVSAATHLRLSGNSSCPRCKTDKGTPGW